MSIASEVLAARAAYDAQMAEARRLRGVPDGYVDTASLDTWGERVRAARQRRVWSVVHMARYMEVHPNTVANWERGGPVRPKAHTRQRLTLLEQEIAGD